MNQRRSAIPLRGSNGEAYPNTSWEFGRMQCLQLGRVWTVRYYRILSESCLLSAVASQNCRDRQELVFHKNLTGVQCDHLTHD